MEWMRKGQMDGKTVLNGVRDEMTEWWSFCESVKKAIQNVVTIKPILKKKKNPHQKLSGHKKKTVIKMKNIHF